MRGAWGDEQEAPDMVRGGMLSKGLVSERPDQGGVTALSVPLQPSLPAPLPQRMGPALSRHRWSWGMSEGHESYPPSQARWAGSAGR